MHLLQAKAGTVTDGSEAVDLGQTPADIVILSAADTEIASFAGARQRAAANYPELRLANYLQLAHPMSVDLYIDTVISQAKLVVARLLGGKSYWNYGVEQLAQTCRRHNIAIALLPGDDQPDPELVALSNIASDDYHRLWQYCVHGGPDNAQQFLQVCARLTGRDTDWLEPRPLLRAGIYWPGAGDSNLAQVRQSWQADAPVAAIVFYRALLQAGNLKPIDALIARLSAQGVNALPIFCASLKDPLSAEVITDLLTQSSADVVLNTTGFAISSPGHERKSTPFDVAGCVVLQVVLSGGTAEQWRSETRGLAARDIAMNVALPEVDGRVLSRAISFKAEATFDALTQCAIVNYEIEPTRIDFVAKLACAWVKLRRTPAPQRKLAIVLANYPNRDGRLGNGVGLDTPAGTINSLRVLATAGYEVSDIPPNGDALIAAIQAGPTNAATDGRVIREAWAIEAYEAAFAALPLAVRAAVLDRWGPVSSDPFYVAERRAIALPVIRYGKILVGLQPARGYNINPTETYHDPDLVPPHGYFAFYLWLREHEKIHAIAHMGKHGNLEWLPGKALALSEACFPEAVLGPLPHLYPFIVNDPGEGTQAKRRSQAVIIDHLTPPLTRAETYGPLAQLEHLVDEYYEASGVDPRRLALLQGEILDLAEREGLASDCGIAGADAPAAALGKLDNYLCELKELQIRDGLHIFGQSPLGPQLDNLLVALTRVPRGPDEGRTASLTRAIARDLELGEFDPLDCNMGLPWDGPRPGALAIGNSAWRTHGDTVERVEDLALQLISNQRAPESEWHNTHAVLDHIASQIRPAVSECGLMSWPGC